MVTENRCICSSLVTLATAAAAKRGNDMDGVSTWLCLTNERQHDDSPWYHGERITAYMSRYKMSRYLAFSMSGEMGGTLAFHPSNGMISVPSYRVVPDSIHQIISLAGIPLLASLSQSCWSFPRIYVGVLIGIAKCGLNAPREKYVDFEAFYDDYYRSALRSSNTRAPYLEVKCFLCG